MGRKRASEEELRRKGNPGKRSLPEDLAVEAPPLRCPPGLSREEKRYWRTWAPLLMDAGKLNTLTVPSFLTLLRMKVRLDGINRFLEEDDSRLLQESVFIDAGGDKHSTFRESAYAKMSRDLTAVVHRLEKSWGLTGDSHFKKKLKKSAEEDFV